MTGYQEILTDPSYAGQIVVMTYPLIGNYGVNEEDIESDKVHVKGFIVKEFCRVYSNYRAKKSLNQYLDENKILAVEGVDTRALTRHLREKGAMKGLISTQDFDEKSLSQKLVHLPSMEGSDWVREVMTQKKYVWKAWQNQGSFSSRSQAAVPQKLARFKVAALDCGIKFNILRILSSLGCEIHVFPADTPFKEIIAIKPDGFFISNGPGDPAAVTYAIKTIREMFGQAPLFGICLGHQMVGLALGGRTYKLKFGHHGANHPVKDSLSNRIGITCQNHGFCVDMDSLNKDEIELIDVNLNDHTLEGIRHKKMPIVSFQHHPEASPGPHDAQYLFEYFLEMMEKFKK